MIQQFHSGYIPKRNESRYVKRDAYTHAQHSIIDNSQKGRATRESINK